MISQPRRGFGGLAVRGSRDALGARAAVLGVASSAGAPHAGAENGPTFLRAASRRYTWGYPDGTVAVAADRRAEVAAVDLGDVLPTTEDAGDVARDVAAVVAGIDLATVPCVIGGDHSITLGVIDGLITRGTPPARVVQFDHHLDVQVWQPAAGVGLDPLFNTNVISHIGRRLGGASVVQIGVDPFLAVSAAAKHTLDDAMSMSADVIPVTSGLLRDDAAFRARVASDLPTYVTVDVDVIQQSQMSSTGYPAHLGLDTVELIRLMELVLRSSPVVGFDVVEFGAARDARGEQVLGDAARAADVLMTALAVLAT